MTPQEVRNKRLANDYKEMVNIRGDVIQWRAVRGEAPYVEEYDIIIKVKSIVNATPNYRGEHTVRLTLPANYPVAAPNIQMISSPYVFHPNWYLNGKWCYGSWIISEGLGHHIIRMIKTLQYDIDITNEHSPANREAKDWYVSNRNRGLFPCDKTNLPDPTKKKMIFNAQTKKRFDINS